MKEEEELDGVLNPSADRVKRNFRTWSDTNLTKEYPPNTTPFDTLQCRCGWTKFQVLQVDGYATAAQCGSCGLYYKVHCG